MKLSLCHLFNFIEIIVKDEIVDSGDYKTKEKVGNDVGKSVSYNPHYEDKIL